MLNIKLIVQGSDTTMSNKGTEVGYTKKRPLIL